MSASFNPIDYTLLLEFQIKYIDPLSEMEPNKAGTEGKINELIKNLPKWCSPELRKEYDNFKAALLTPNSGKIFEKIQQIKKVALKDLEKESVARKSKAPTQPTGVSPPKTSAARKLSTMKNSNLPSIKEE